MKYDFDHQIDRTLSKCRKWDPGILKNKFGLREDAIPMDLADLDFECAPAIKQALIDRAALGDYGPSYTYDAYYDALISWNQRRFDVSIQRDWIKLVFGTCSTLHYIVQCFCQPSDAVMINTPAYDPFAEAIEHGGCRMICNPLRLQNMRYYLDFELMEQQMIEEHVKLFIFCSPQNPSGRIWSKEELHQLSTLCIKHHVLLVCDEIHRDILFDKKAFTTLWNAEEEIKHHSIMCVSPTKGFNLGGLKASYVIVENQALREQLLAYLQRVYVTSPHVFAVPAIVAAYQESEDWLDQLTAYIKENFELLYAWFAQHMPKAKVMKAESSFLAWIDMREVFQNEDEMKAFFIKANLSMVVGSYFVKDGEGWVRLNVGTQKAILKEAFTRMEEAYRDWI